MILQKWNPDTHEYEPFNSPAENIVFITEDMDTLTDCAECWKSVRYWDTYSSKQIHTSRWLWYAVCPDCFKKERK